MQKQDKKILPIFMVVVALLAIGAIGELFVSIVEKLKATVSLKTKENVTSEELALQKAN